MADNYFNHQELVKKTKLILSKKYPSTCRVFDRPIGLLYKKRIDQGVIEYTPIKIGKNGQCDLWGVIGCTANNSFNDFVIPIHFELEVKTGKGRLNPDQENWKSFCEEMNWIWLETRENTDVVFELEKKVRELGLWVA